MRLKRCCENLFWLCQFYMDFMRYWVDWFCTMKWNTESVSPIYCVDDDVWNDDGWKGLKGWGSNGNWCIIHKIDYILTMWLTNWWTNQNPEMLLHLKSFRSEPPSKEIFFSKNLSSAIWPKVDSGVYKM